MSSKNLDLTERQQEDKAAFRAFVDREVAPHAGRFDQEEHLPSEIIEKMVQAGYWGADIPEAYGGPGIDEITYGLLMEELGRGCANVRNLVGVQGMVSSVILKWGDEAQRTHWLPKMAAGEVVAAFALTEPDIGSDAAHIKTTATPADEAYVLNGRKKWISFGQMADLLLVFAQSEGRVTAFLVETQTPGLSVQPISGLLGFRASMLAELHFDTCRVPEQNMVGGVGFGLSHVAAYGLSHGRYSTAWGCVGLAQGCLEACLRYTSEREQFGARLKQHQLIQEMIADMYTHVTASRLLCHRAGRLREAGDREAIMAVSMAKYFASRVAATIASDAVQIHGANGCSDTYPVQRYLRDAKIMEIVEGSTQVQQVLVSKYAYRVLAG